MKNKELLKSIKIFLKYLYGWEFDFRAEHEILYMNTDCYITPTDVAKLEDIGWIKENGVWECRLRN